MLNGRGSARRWLLAGFLLGVAGGSAAGEVRELRVERSEEGLRVSMRLEDAFPREILDRIESGLNVEFAFTVRLRRQRGMVDKTVAEREVAVSVQYSNLTKMYRLTRRVDGTVIESDVTDSAHTMRAWLTTIERLPLFDRRDLEDAGSYYVRAKAKLLSRFRMLLVPWDLDTEWVNSGGFAIAGQPR